jgi:hypothetical protein
MTIHWLKSKVRYTFLLDIIEGKNTINWRGICIYIPFPTLGRLLVVEIPCFKLP